MPNLSTAAVPSLARPAAARPGLSFTIGQDESGCWVALESRGIAGGLFRNRDDAIHYAGVKIRNGAGEIRFATGPVAFTAGR
ncbi:RAG2 PHD domain containing protein [Methylobacterium sp. WL120]|uniref:RAG2 PHD domain containing protein n=1 Tax=Methylobacterium sp. WL120 TaxID=2603887 RepID=UPI0011CA0748|nr:RAG2 PHD domain containing protein [Methylobacterium sp. WL120]TXM67299.1 RAG2 PHD domain containing protein [Methylobacterium sp. WL120]